jgi:hypothetical protein
MTPLYAQVSVQCTAEAIKGLLRDIQELSSAAKTEIHISGTKEELLSNLQLAVNRGYATTDQVKALLWDSEEVGKQHVLLLQPAPAGLASGSVDIRDINAVAVALFGEVPFTELFPRYEYPSSGYGWSDFRRVDGGWLAKAYGREIYRQSEGVVDTEDLGNGVIQEVRQYKWKEVKATLVANWRSAHPGILEIRIDISGMQNKQAVDERREAIWTLLRPAIDRSNLIGLDIDGLLTSIIEQRSAAANAAAYSIGRVELMDPRSGQVRVIPKGSDAFDNDPGRSESLKAMLENGFKPSLVRVDWKPGIEGCPKSMTETVAVVIEKTSNGPELRILKRINGETYGYIFDQLRRRL